MRRPTTALGLVSVACLSLLAACGSEAEVVEGDDGILLVAAATDGGMDAMVIGTVVRVGSCLGLEGEADPILAVWPAGTEQGDVAVGDSVRGSGGYLSPPYPEELPDLPADCVEAAGGDEVAWVQALDADGR